MSEPFIAEIRIIGFTFAPRGWAFCNGQLLPVSQNTALFSLLGTIYGGDGRSTFALPNLQGRAPMQPGRGPGLTARRLGETGGTDTVTLSEAQMPAHQHNWQVSARTGNANDPGTDTYLAGGSSDQFLYGPPSNLVDMHPGALADNGGGQSHNNMQPFLTLNFVIALVGLYPSRG